MFIEDAFKNIEGENRTMATAGVFATYPQPYLSVAGGIIDQIVGTAFLCICVCLITDKNNKIPAHLQPLLIGLLVAMIGMSIGMNCGYAINPARDLGPRLLTLCAGWGWQTFSFNGYKWFWIPIVCPMIGAVIGAWIYELCLGLLLSAFMFASTHPMVECKYTLKLLQSFSNECFAHFLGLVICKQERLYNTAVCISGVLR
ncbi:unnamed protein product [Toxocara canis]|uniref:Aquaporin-9 n=1 Tax=Toxocara canis TaxID=6265 RepID=A0A183U369_TOXCA|nr:unnamed protein product [Toxocara canis]